jgi:hypothetical protein
LNHRDTEAQRRHRATHIANTKTQRHEGITKASQSHSTARFLTQRRKARHSRIQRRGAEAQRAHEDSPRCEVPAVVERRPGTAGSDNGSERKRSSPVPGPAACALEEHRPRHTLSPFHGWEEGTCRSNWKEVRRNRRAIGAAHQFGDPPSRPLRLCGSLRMALRLRTSAPLRLCVLLLPRAAFVSLCLRVCDVLRASAFLLSVFLLCVSVPLWFNR